MPRRSDDGCSALPKSHLANLTGWPFLSDSVALSAEQPGFQPVLARGARLQQTGSRHGFSFSLYGVAGGTLRSGAIDNL